ncbi:MAG: AAA family ATPase [Gammaproteobacteria bacterium RIFCSPHIGHO2_12_FULL_45_9]|nr:MAG: AAA family ATPase [Gammaproteobacteria bacterium RIFCSPHIGHO2_12_FULL_45_9]
MQETTYQRPILKELCERIAEPRHHIQVLWGPRQVGKTTLVEQLLSKINILSHYVSADQPVLNDVHWLEQQWQRARLLLKQAVSEQGVLLILDEIQKIEQWSAIVKQYWDEDSFHKRNIKVLLLGSSAWLVQQGLTESLAGRFEILSVTHWSYPEMQAAFGFSVEQYAYFGGYPGAAAFIQDEKRWRNYIVDSLIETTISRDILLMARVDKPALLRKLFEFSCHYASQIFSLQKIMGQLQDRGNMATLSHYLQLLDTAGMIRGLEKFSGKVISQKSSSPKLQVQNMALMSAIIQRPFAEVSAAPEVWGRYIESAVGAHLINMAKSINATVYYWREGQQEVDFVVVWGGQILAIEVKSGLKKNLGGFKAFTAQYPVAKTVLVGGSGIPLVDFLMHPLTVWFEV